MHHMCEVGSAKKYTPSVIKNNMGFQGLISSYRCIAHVFAKKGYSKIYERQQFL